LYNKSASSSAAIKDRYDYKTFARVRESEQVPKVYCTATDCPEFMKRLIDDTMIMEVIRRSAGEAGSLVTSSKDMPWIESIIISDQPKTKPER